jgi:hypothetical protein
MMMCAAPRALDPASHLRPHYPEFYATAASCGIVLMENPSNPHFRGLVPRVILNLPHPEKDRAKELGAKWDAVQKEWYVPDGVELWPFEPWFTDDFKRDHPEITSEDYTLRVNGFWIIKTTSPCSYCFRPTDVIGFVLPYDHFQLEEDDAGRTYWRKSNIDTEQLLTGVTKLNASALDAASTISCHYKRCIKNRIKDGTEYTGPYVSHCAHCGKAFPEMRGNLVHPLFPATYEEAEKISSCYFNEEFMANADYTNTFWDDCFLDVMEIV